MLDKLKSLLKSEIDFMYKYSVYILFSIIIIWMFLVCGFSTSCISGNWSEHTYFIKDSFFKNALFLSVFILFIFSLNRSHFIKNIKLKIVADNKLFAAIKRFLLLLIFISGVLIVICSQTVPCSDQYLIMKCAFDLKNCNYEEFLPGGYAYTYPNQISIIVFLRIFSFLFGDFNYIVFQFLSVIGLVVVYYQLSALTGLLGMDKLNCLYILLFGIIFLPLIFYTTFVYGTILGLACALTAMRCEMLFFQNYRMKDLLGTAFFITLSLIFKSNYLIFLLAILIYALVNFIRNFNFKILILICIVILGGFLQGKAFSWYISGKTGQEIGNGASAWSFIAMGLQDNGGDGMRYGWYNAYNADTFEKNGFDNMLQAKEAKEYIRNRMKYFLYHKKELISFMGHKQASQWNNPTYQGFWICQVCTSDINQPSWIKWLFSVDTVDKFTKLFNIVQFLCLAGTIFFLFFSPCRTDKNYLLFQMIFVGGFAFHLFWEAKCQYVISYFVLIVPLSLNGYQNFIRELENTIGSISKGKNYINKVSVFASISVLLIGILEFDHSQLIKNTVKIDDDTQEYGQYIAFHTSDKITNGVYQISPYTDRNISLQCEMPQNDDIGAKIKAAPPKEADIYLYREGNKIHIRFENTGLYLDLTKGTEAENAPVQAWTQNSSMAQKWVVKKLADYENAYYILIGNHSALTYNEETRELCIGRFNYGDAQKWIIQKSQK